MGVYLLKSDPTLAIEDFPYFTILIWVVHPSLEGSGTPWVRAQESNQHPISFNTKPNKMTVAVLNLYASVFSSSTKKVWQNLNMNFNLI